MPDIRLRLLELTRSDPGLNMEDLATTPKGSVETELAELRRHGIVSYSHGVWTMDEMQRVKLAEQLIHEGKDPKKVARLLGWQEFEDFVQHILFENGFQTQKHLIFKTRSGSREIDVLAWNDTFTLAVDCKQWRNGLSTGRMRKAAQAQIERATSLAWRPELLHRLKLDNPERRSITPVILALGELRDRLVDGVPVVPVSKLLSFLYGLSPLDDNIKRLKVPQHGPQSRLA